MWRTCVSTILAGARSGEPRVFWSCLGAVSVMSETLGVSLWRQEPCVARQFVVDVVTRR